MNGWKNDENMDAENRARTEGLAQKISRLKNVAFDIELEAKDQNYVLDSMGSEFDSSQGLLGGSVQRFGNMISSSKNNRKIMCYLSLGIVAFFLFIYYIYSWIS